ncbi:TRAP transporter substrate-binding protein [Oceanibaculum sp.]|uniref:TRAP transporter substrate-binding protein n=1 Tax=Oceanibaculum sp. TaxID=1903597 RepID=UPI00259024E7|nr:TRAP transporter substrate-binding protein [Oceanibaculum sp.]MCH2395913.1 TRAP transporter substrate-binding protein [Oceanibaculum sp.]
MERRKFLKSAALGGAGVAATAAAFPAPALSQGKMEWRMVTSWPKGLPGLGTGAERLAKRITDATDGRLSIKVFAGGELVPALQVWDAVSSGTADMGHDAAYYHIGKSAGTPFFSTVPFGMTTHELNAWIKWGGGQELWDEFYAPFNLKAFHAGNTGVQMGGWFRKEITSADDLKGLKFRMPGQGGQVLQKLGATVVLLPGGEIFPALQSGAIDGTEWVGPYNDLSLGFHQVAKFYYYPGFHEPAPGIQATFNKAKYDALPKDIKAIIEACCAAENELMVAEFNQRSGPALQTLIRDHGVQLKQFSRDILEAFGTKSGELMEELLASSDPMVKKIAEEYLKARRLLMSYTRITEQGYTNARSLPFKYPG